LGRHISLFVLPFELLLLLLLLAAAAAATPTVQPHGW
jgi:hypothetical protein